MIKNMSKKTNRDNDEIFVETGDDRISMIAEISTSDDSGMKLDFDQIETIPANEKSKNTFKDCKVITDPIDQGSEDLFYQILKKGEVNLKNDNLGISCKMEYDVNKLPYLVQWKNLISGDYVLGIEPSTVRFDAYKKVNIDPQEKKTYNIALSFEKF